MSQRLDGRESATDAPALASDQSLWVTRKRCRRELGVDDRVFPKVLAAARIRTRRIPGASFPKYYLPDIQRVAREAIRETGPTMETARSG